MNAFKLLGEITKSATAAGPYTYSLSETPYPNAPNPETRMYPFTQHGTMKKRKDREAWQAAVDKNRAAAQAAPGQPQPQPPVLADQNQPKEQAPFVGAPA